MKAVVYQGPFKLTAYDQFDERADGWTKVSLHPGTAS